LTGGDRPLRGSAAEKAGPGPQRQHDQTARSIAESGDDLPDFLVMGRRWTGDRLLIVAGLALATGAIAVLVWLSHLPSDEQDRALAYWGFVLALVGAVASLWGWLRRVRRPTEPRPVKVLAARLAEAVYGQWRKAAEERRLVTPAPILIRWSLSDSDMAGPVVAAIGSPDQLPAFPPLPGHTTVTEEQLRAGGARRELHQLFAGLASGRIVVVGAPGAGKSGAAILLLLDTLAHRDSLDATERARVPVPVLLTGYGWDPNTISAQDWLRNQLVATYPLFQRRGGDADAAALVAARDKIALILDGLDEMDEALRPAALQALSDAPFRVMVLTRSPEMTQAARKAWLVGAVAVQLHNVPGPQAADYLERARTGPPPSGWTDLLTRLREHPGGLLARGLSTPLTLSLLRDTYHTGDDLDALLDPTRYDTDEQIERHLIARILPTAYTPRPGRPPPRYSETQACHALTFLAQRMNQDHTRDLAWWQIPRWAATMPRTFITGLKYGLGHGLVFGLVFGLALALVVGLMPEPTAELGMLIIVLGLMIGLMVGLAFGLMGWYTSWFATKIGPKNSKGLKPRRIRIASWRAFASRRALGAGIGGGFGGVLVGLLTELPGGLPPVGLTGGFVLALAGVPAGVLVSGLTEDGIIEGRPLGPSEIWRNDRAARLITGLMPMLPLGLLPVLTDGVGFMAIIWPGLVLILISFRADPATLAWRTLKLADYVPAVKLMPFLEDARDRGVLRTVGGVYQFRHATLQDQLADQTIPNSAISRVS
jgi:hypothetical protein